MPNLGVPAADWRAARRDLLLDAALELRIPD
jgi:hypothetical protein